MSRNENHVDFWNSKDNKYENLSLEYTEKDISFDETNSNFKARIGDNRNKDNYIVQEKVNKIRYSYEAADSNIDCPEE